MSEKKHEEARGKMWQILHDHMKHDEWSGVVFDILSIPEIAIVDREAELPDFRAFIDLPQYHNGLSDPYFQGQADREGDMLEAGFKYKIVEE